MSAVIVGSPASSATATNAKVLRRQEYQKEINGLETLVETYLVQSQNLLSLIPAKDTTHQSYSSATVKYPRMAVETISTSEQDGNITELNITFVGLTSSSGLPPAVVRIIPVSGAGIYGPPINIEAQFVSDSTENDFLSGRFSSTSATGISSSQIITEQVVTRMPPFINGTKMPANPKEPFIKQSAGGFGVAGGVFTPSGSYAQYEGYILTSSQFEKRGQFLAARITFAEFLYGLTY